MKKIVIVILLLTLLTTFAFSDISNFTGSYYLTLSPNARLAWCIGFLQATAEVVYLLQCEYQDSSYLDFWSGGYIPVDVFMENLEYFLKNSEDARNTPLPYVGLIVVQSYYEKHFKN